MAEKKKQGSKKSSVSKSEKEKEKKSSKTTGKKKKSSAKKSGAGTVKKTTKKTTKKPVKKTPKKTAKKTVKKTPKKTAKKTTKKVTKKTGKNLPAKTSRKPKKVESKPDVPKEYEDSDMDSDALNRGDIPMTVVDHLDEFRSRILISLGVIIVFTVAGFFFSDYLVNFINEPFNQTGQKLNIFKLTGGFIIRIKVALVAAIMLSLPVIIFQLWRFIFPAVSKKDRWFSRISIFSATMLFYGGIAFVFFVILPFAIKVLLGFIGEEMISTIGANDYISFILIASLAMGFLFELPIIVMVLTKIGIITPEFLIQKRKYSLIGIWIIAAIITPQDILTQVVVGIPLMFLYEISILISKIIVRRKKKRELQEENST